jgi:hypothetical protein
MAMISSIWCAASKPCRSRKTAGDELAVVRLGDARDVHVAREAVPLERADEMPACHVPQEHAAVAAAADQALAVGREGERPDLIAVASVRRFLQTQRGCRRRAQYCHQQVAFLCTD